MAWNFRTALQSGTEAALDVSDYFLDEEQAGPNGRQTQDAMNAADRNQFNQLKHAIVRGDLAAVAQQLADQPTADEAVRLLNLRLPGENTLLNVACQTGHLAIVDHLLGAGADALAVNARQQTVLYAAIHHGHAPIVRRLLAVHPELVLQATAEKWSALHAACINGCPDIARQLIEYPYPDAVLRAIRGANRPADGDDSTETIEYRLPFDPNARDITGQTPLYVACLLGNTALVQLLFNWRVPFRRCCARIVEKERHHGGGDAITSASSTPSSTSTTTTPATTPSAASSRRRVSMGIQSIMDRLYLVRDGAPDSATDDGPAVDEAQPPSSAAMSAQPLRCPLELNQLCGAPRETALLAAVRGGYTEVVGLLLEHGADPNAIAKPLGAEDEENSMQEELYGCSNSPLAEATRQTAVEILDLLLKHNAHEDMSTAMIIACTNNDDRILGRLLSRQAHADPEYKINKQRMDTCLDKNVAGAMTATATRNITYSNIFPTNAVMIDWHLSNCQLNHVKVAWLLNTVQHCNPKLRINPQLKHVALGAITRIDLSFNALTHLPHELFTQLCSLRTLNVARNRLQKLPHGNSAASGAPAMRYDCPQLEELYLQDNQLEEVPAAVFALPALVTLDVSNNKLQALPYAMWTAFKLRDLNVAFNLLKDLPFCTSNVNAIAGDEENLFQELNLSHSHGRRNRLTHIDLIHHSVWSKNLEISEQDLPFGVAGDPLFDDSSQTAGQLTYLNLANNLFTSIPLALPCLAVNLTRLNMSYNSLRSMGHVTSYPASLRQLDLSHNEITCWPSLPSRLSTADPHLACYNTKTATATTTADASDTPSTPNSAAQTPDHPPARAFNSPAPGSTNSSSSAAASVPQTLRSAVLKTVCTHRKHLRLESLRTLILADNLLTRIQLTTDDAGACFTPDATVPPHPEDSDWTLVAPNPTPAATAHSNRQRLMFPNLSMLDISNNCLKEIPSALHELANLSVLNISGNIDITDLPANMGLLGRLWNLNTRGCSLQGPLRSMIDNGKYKTMDIVGYLKSVYEDARPYARMKLMVVGTQGIGKTSLLELLRHEGGTNSSSSASHRAAASSAAIAANADHWTKRIGTATTGSPSNGGSGHSSSSSAGHQQPNISTVGVDIGNWVCDRRSRGSSQSAHGAVTFRTWDFGGQKEYYTTHQYFLSKRSLYIVVWRLIDGKAGLAEVLQWLANIQARAPNSPVLIVGTHHDAIGLKLSAGDAARMQQTIRERFIAVTDAEKLGLPRVIDSVEVSCRTGHNVAQLAQLIYEVAFSLRAAGSKEPLLHQKVPSTYLALEDCVAGMAAQLHAAGMDPVLSFERYREMVGQEMLASGQRMFRDAAELHQATMFLHDNGVVLHYDDATLRDLYFVDPQWLCDMLAHVVTVREINPFPRNGIMRMDDLQHIFKQSHMAAWRGTAAAAAAAGGLSKSASLHKLHGVGMAGGIGGQHAYIVNLLNKFEVALTWDSRTLLIPSLLPAAGRDCAVVRIVAKSIAQGGPGGGWHSKATRAMNGVGGGVVADAVELPARPLDGLVAVAQPPGAAIARLLLMSYFPSGFWSRLLTRILADAQIVGVLGALYPNLAARTDVDCTARWHLWQTGIALHVADQMVFHMREIPVECTASPYRNVRNQFQLKQDDNWCGLDVAASSILETVFPVHTLRATRRTEDGDGETTSVVVTEVPIDRQCMTQILALCIDHIDILLEDWYPTLGTRFVHTSEGRFLVTRLIPCPRCLQRLRGSADDAAAAVDGSVGTLADPQQQQQQPVFGRRKVSAMNYTWMMEECILAAYEQSFVACPNHGNFAIADIAPDIMFVDLKESFLIDNKDIVKGSLLGRGAFGFVFKATCRLPAQGDAVPVAMKMLQPVQPGPRAKETAILAYKAILGKWKRDPLQHACKAYCMARQELSVILMLKHPNIVQLVGVCVQPLAIVLEWAPRGALDHVIREFRRAGSRIGPYCFQQLVLQASRAIEYLHRKHIIYRDLKAENVLVWEFPQPHDSDRPTNRVCIKIADYGISRVTLPSGTKGFGGTEGFMAPEIMKYNGEEEYTEKVDCFSFGMLLYELIALRQPFEGHEAVKECILEGGRPVLTRRETLFPCYCLDLMVLCWDQQPKSRPSASQIVSIASAPEFTHLIDVVSLSHAFDVRAAIARKSDDNDDSAAASASAFEVWLSSSSAAQVRIELLTGSRDKWLSGQRILTPQSWLVGAGPAAYSRLRLTAICSVGDTIWVGDSDSNVHAFSAGECSHMFSYTLEPSNSSAVTLLVSLHRIGRVAAGLENGRLFLLDSTLIPSSSTFGEGSFVLTELGTGSRLYAAGVHWISHEECELWCGLAGATINIFSMRESVVSERKTLNHFDTATTPGASTTSTATTPSSSSAFAAAAFPDFTTSLLQPAGDDAPYVYSTVSPGCVLYQWHTGGGDGGTGKRIVQRLDCSKLVPCSESLNSIAIEEHLSPGKCQITALARLQGALYVGTSWGCIVVVEYDTLRPVTIFRPFEDEVCCILPIINAHTPLIATFGRGYRSLIRRYTDSTIGEDRYETAGGSRDALRNGGGSNIHALIWKAEHWVAV